MYHPLHTFSTFQFRKHVDGGGDGLDVLDGEGEAVGGLLEARGAGVRLGELDYFFKWRVESGKWRVEE